MLESWLMSLSMILRSWLRDERSLTVLFLSFSFS